MLLGVDSSTNKPITSVPWYNYIEDITTVDFKNKIVPTDIQYWFFRCTNLTEIKNISNLSTSKVTNMNYMFYSCSGLTNLELVSFNTSNVTNMNGMFSSCSSLTNLDLGSFNTSNVTQMNGMFSGCSGLTNLNLGSFNTSNVTNMVSMFYGCSGLTNLDLGSFNTSNVTTMTNMFHDCSGLTNLDLGSFNTSNVTTMQSMFQGCSSLTNLDLRSFNTSNVTRMSYMFYGCSSLTDIHATKDNWITNNVKYKDGMFSGCAINYITLEDSSIIGYNITKGWGWATSGSTTTSRWENASRASTTELLHLDPTKTYIVSMNNSNYYYGMQGTDASKTVLYDSGRLEPGSVTITGQEYIVINFQYQNAGTTTITDDMINEIKSGFSIKVQQ